MLEAEHGLDIIVARDSQPINSSRTNSSAISAHTVTLSKKVNTALAFSIFLLAAGTYVLLMKYTSSLSNEIILPSEFLGDNLTAVLSSTWPQKYLGSPSETIDDSSCPFVVFCKKDFRALSCADHVEILGSHEVGEEKVGIFRLKMSLMAIKAFSPVMKNLVQIAIWNSVSFWLILAMLVNTLVYNGFMSNNITSDGKLRLLLVGAYAFANIGHGYRTTILLYHNFTFMLFQACWIIICREFVFLDSQIYKSVTMMEAGKNPGNKYPFPASGFINCNSVDLELFGSTKHSDIYRSFRRWGSDRFASEGSKDDKRRDSQFQPQGKVESKFDDFIKPIREAEVKAYEKATDAALEKVLANVAVLLGICLATALAPWTSTQTINATNAQLGSYALLLSISTGLLALVSSITQLTNATESAGTLLLLQEKTIEASYCIWERGNPAGYFSMRDKPGCSFSEGIAGQSPLTSFRLWRSMSFLSKFPCLLFGPALKLIPRFNRNYQSCKHSYGKTTLFKIQNDCFGYRYWSDTDSWYAFRCIKNESSPTKEEQQSRDKVDDEGNKNDDIAEHQQQRNPDMLDAHS